MYEKFVLLIAGATVGGLVQWGFSSLKHSVERKKLRAELVDELSHFVATIKTAASRQDWTDIEVHNSLERLLDFYKIRNPASAFSSYPKKLDIYEYHSELLFFSEARGSFGLANLPMEIRLQVDSMQFDPDQCKLPKRAPLDRINELEQQFHEIADLARSGSLPASKMLTPVANLLLHQIAKAYGGGRAGGVMTEKVRAALDELHSSFPENAFRRLVAATDQVLASLS